MSCSCIPDRLRVALSQSSTIGATIGAQALGGEDHVSCTPLIEDRRAQPWATTFPEGLRAVNARHERQGQGQGQWWYECEGPWLQP